MSAEELMKRKHFPHDFELYVEDIRIRFDPNQIIRPSKSKLNFLTWSFFTAVINTSSSSSSSSLRSGKSASSRDTVMMFSSFDAASTIFRNEDSLKNFIMLI